MPPRFFFQKFNEITEINYDMHVSELIFDAPPSQPMQNIRDLIKNKEEEFFLVLD